MKLERKKLLGSMEIITFLKTPSTKVCLDFSETVHSIVVLKNPLS